jgi:type 1 glutamine amidotransferase
MKKLLLVLTLFATLLVSTHAAEKPEEKTEDPVRVLLITGRDVQAHDWRKTTPILREHLEQTGRFEVVVSEEPLVLESSALKDYDVILLNYYNWKRPGLTEKARDNLLGFVRGGKGLVSFHYSCRAFEDWPEFRNLIGRVWIGNHSGHGPRGTFNVRVKDRDHYITEGLGDFEADDELYAKLVGDTDIHVLVEADSEWSGKTEPIAWVLDYGKGLVFNIVLGHDEKACRNAQFARLLTRGTLWVARADKP